MSERAPGPNDATRQRLQRALAFIDAHLHRPLRTVEIAQAAAFSEHHFHRLFLALTGERVGQYVTRRRLEAAARRLAYEPDRSVTDIALSSGYSSPANFSKAFSAYFGVSPSAVRGRCSGPVRAGLLEARYGKAFDPSAFFTAVARDPREATVEHLQARLRFEERAETHLVCRSGPGGYDLPAALALWGQFSRTLVNLGLWGHDTELLGVVHDDPVVTHEALCRYDACVSVARPPAVLPPPLTHGRLPAGRFAVFPFCGSQAELDLYYRDVYAAWFPQSGLRPGPFPPVERYLSRGPVDGRFELELLFTIRPQGAP